MCLCLGLHLCLRETCISQHVWSYRQSLLLEPQFPRFSGVISDLCSDAACLIAFWSKDPNLGDNPLPALHVS